MLLAYPFLPPDDIVAAFEMLSQHHLVESEDRVKQLVTYFSQTWMLKAAWTPTSWCVYRDTVRTNNDVEGWPPSLEYEGATRPAGRVPVGAGAGE